LSALFVSRFFPDGAGTAAALAAYMPLTPTLLHAERAITAKTAMNVMFFFILYPFVVYPLCGVFYNGMFT
jgi:hypothetical protein